MTLDELITAFRFRMDDTKTPYLWDDDEIVSYVNQAVDEACIRARLLLDNTLTLSVVAGTAEYAVPDKVFFIERVALPTNQALVKTNLDYLDNTVGKKWLTETGTPRAYFEDYNQHKLTLYPIPEENGTYKLTVYRTPTTALSADLTTQSPEINAVFHADLLHWAAHLAYLKHDADTYSLEKSDHARGMFEMRFGRRPDVRQMEYLRKHNPLRTKAYFF